jgi:2-oxoglutarate dehydrogenase E1 component
VAARESDTTADAALNERGDTAVSQESPGSDPMAAFGPNEWLVDELYQRYQEDKNSVDQAWWQFFADYSPNSGGATRTTAPGAPADKNPAAPPLLRVQPWAWAPVRPGWVRR